jgi:23S rRNA G2445 N2-methylase RlmL
VIVDELRIVGSTQTNLAMRAEVLRIAKRALRFRPPEPRKEGLGQLVFPFQPDLARIAVTYLRTPTRVVWDVYRSRATQLAPLYHELSADMGEDTRALYRNGDTISVEVRHVEAFAAGERQIVGTVKNALIDAAARNDIRLRVDPERPTSRWIVRGADSGEVTVSIDLGGGSLSQRGWRLQTGAAPLREHLAAVLLMLSRFDPRSDTLVDPMCGSGTLPIEAMHMARGIPRRTPTLDALGLGTGAAPSLFPDSSPMVIGCDIDVNVLAAARDNARRAQLDDAVVWQRCDVADLTPKTVGEICSERGREFGAGLLIANPPYGDRLEAGSGQSLEDLYHDIAGTCARFHGWRAAFLCGNPQFERVCSRVLGRPRIKKPIANANVRSYFLLYDL